MSNNYDFIVVGAGIVGLATAYKLQLKFPEKSIAILARLRVPGNLCKQFIKTSNK